MIFAKGSLVSPSVDLSVFVSITLRCFPSVTEKIFDIGTTHINYLSNYMPSGSRWTGYQLGSGLCLMNAPILVCNMHQAIMENFYQNLFNSARFSSWAGAMV